MLCRSITFLILLKHLFALHFVTNGSNWLYEKLNTVGHDVAVNLGGSRLCVVLFGGILIIF